MSINNFTIDRICSKLISTLPLKKLIDKAIQCDLNAILEKNNIFFASSLNSILKENIAHFFYIIPLKEQGWKWYHAIFKNIPITQCIFIYLTERS